MFKVLTRSIRFASFKLVGAIHVFTIEQVFQSFDLILQLLVDLVDFFDLILVALEICNEVFPLLGEFSSRFP